MTNAPALHATAASAMSAQGATTPCPAVTPQSGGFAGLLAALSMTERPAGGVIAPQAASPAPAGTTLAHVDAPASTLAAPPVDAPLAPLSRADTKQPAKVAPKPLATVKTTRKAADCQNANLTTGPVSPTPITPPASAAALAQQDPTPAAARGGSSKTLTDTAQAGGEAGPVDGKSAPLDAAGPQAAAVTERLVAAASTANSGPALGADGPDCAVTPLLSVRLEQAVASPTPPSAALNGITQQLAPTGAAAPPKLTQNAAGLQPAQQVAPVLIQLGQSAGAGHMTLRLAPEELGQVQVQIDRGADGSASVHVTAERPETLRLLIADQGQLHHALDAAGVPQEGRTLSLSLGTADQGGLTSSSSGSNGSGQEASSGGQQNQRGRPSYGWDQAASAAADGGATASWLRAGVDITA